MPSKKESATLPHKEAGLFKRMVKAYEQKQYKPGLKLAKQIISNPKCADHGETLAMKGLILNCLGKKDEAYENVKRGLKNDVRSYLCWHVYGLLHRSDRKYEQAISAYLNALRIDEKNMQILRDLSTLQIHMRDLEGFKQTRFRMVSLKPTQPVNWISLAIANHMLGDLQLAYRTLEEYRSNSTPNETAGADLEYSEVILYQVELLLDLGQCEEALIHLGKHHSFVVDKMAALELKGQALRKLNRVGEAKTVYWEMLKRNPYNRDIVQAIVELEKLANENEKLAFIVKIRAEFPESRQVAMLPLLELTGDNFRHHFLEAARNSFVKGIPAFFADIKPIYGRDADKVRLIGETILLYYQKLKADTTNISAGGDNTGMPASVVADSDIIDGRPRCILRLWTTLFLAQHFDKLGMYAEALHYVDESIEIAPTLLEALCVKARIFKHLGRFDDAVALTDAAQRLDTADRYLNYKCAKYLLRANRIRDAEKLMSNFPREGTKTEENQLEMQAYWFLFEKAQALFRLQLYGDALRICQHAARIFNEMVEDQFDFHLYCLRKFTIRSYIRMLHEADRIHANRFYLKFACIAVTIYLLLLDGKISTKRDNLLNESLALIRTDGVLVPLVNETASETLAVNADLPVVAKDVEDNNSDETREAELRERFRQEREAVLTATKKTLGAAAPIQTDQQEAAGGAKSDATSDQRHAKNKHQQHQQTTDDDAVGNAPPVEYDPQELLNTKDPLEEAYKLIKPLLSLERIDNAQALRLAFEVCRRKKQVPAMLRCCRMLERHQLYQVPENVLLQLWQQLDQLRAEHLDQLSDPVHTLILEAKHATPALSSTTPLINHQSNNTIINYGAMQTTTNTVHQPAGPNLNAQSLPFGDDVADECAARMRNLALDRTMNLQQHRQHTHHVRVSSQSSSSRSRAPSLSTAATAANAAGGEPAASNTINNNINTAAAAASAVAANTKFMNPLAVSSSRAELLSPSPSKQQQLYMSASAAHNDLQQQQQQQQPNGVL